MTIRVRNRLAQTPDNKLGQVLLNLLPRLLRKLDRNAARVVYAPSTTSSSAFTDPQQQQPQLQEQLLRQQIQSQLLGTLSHCSERVRSINVNKNASVINWMEPVVEELPSWKSSITLTVAMSLLETAMPRCRGVSKNNNTAKTLLPGLMTFLEAQHSDLLFQETVEQSRKLQLRSAGWLILDTMALSSGMRVYSDWDLMVDGNTASGSKEAVSWDVLEEAPLPDMTAAQQVCGLGMLDWMLDVLLFWPATQSTDAGTSGLSVEGLERINHKRHKSGAVSSWDDLYLRQLKYVSVRYCLGAIAAAAQQQSGLFAEDRALLIAILTASGNSTHGRLAVSYLNQVVGTKNLVRREGRKRWAVNSESLCSIHLAVSLLILMIGDVDAAPVLSEYEASCGSLWKSVIGPRPTEATLVRSPLPVPVASKCVEFLLDHFRPTVKPSGTTSNNNDNDLDYLRLFLDLVVVLQDPSRHGVNWGIQLIHNIYSELRDADAREDWVAAFYERCLKTAISVLKSISNASAGTGEIGNGRGGGPLMDLPEGVPQPFGVRRDLTGLLRDHRERQQRNRLQTSVAMRAREVAYKMVAQLANETTIGEDDTQNKLSFEIPIVLFQCASAEDEKMQAHLARAMEAVLSVYKRLASMHAGITSDAMREHLVARLLPSLVSAACVDNAGCRMETVRWLSVFLLNMDPAASLHICSYLAQDADPFVSGLAKKALPKLKMMAGDVVMSYMTVKFLNAEDSVDRQTIRDDLEHTIDQMTTAGEIDRSAASVLLYDSGFSLESVLVALQNDKSTALEDCGLRRRSDAMQESQSGSKACGICYEDATMAYSMVCGHSFCLDCWQSYLRESVSSAAGTSAILRMHCPQHDCLARVTADTLQELSPDLLSTWNSAFLNSFTERNSKYSHCTGPDCHMIAHTETPPGVKGLPVTCESCDTSFCFHCSELPHQPARCNDHREWQRIFGSSSFWVRKNSKPCPSCRVPIEKNKGCNHMTCSRCGADFCWLCLSLLQTHMQTHTCNQYDPTADAADDEERRALFFTDRFQAHDDAGLYANDKLKVLNEKGESLAGRLWFVAEQEFETLVETTEELVAARQFLKWSYVAAWAIRSEPVKLDVFQMSQATLELVTERLTQMALANLEQVFATQGERGVRLHFRAMTFLRSTIRRYKQRILAIEDSSSFAS